MGKKKEKYSTATADLILSTTTRPKPNSNTGTSGRPGSADGGVASVKKVKKHKHKKSSRKDKRSEKIIPKVNPNQVEMVQTLMLEEDDEEIFIDDDEMEVDNSLIIESTSDIKIVQTPDTSTEKSPGLKLLQKTKSEKGKSTSGSSKKSKRKDGASAKGDDDTDSEEERWLDAIESGKLEEVDDELKRIKNPRLMTARQRALMEKRTDGGDEGNPVVPAEPLLALPTGLKEKVLTEEMLVKKAIKSQRRREQAFEKREEDKKKTVDRLLKKQDSRITKASRAKSLKLNVPLISYTVNHAGVFLSFPADLANPPIAPIAERNMVKPVICGVEGCFKLKKYSCSKSGVPLCSLECYKKNIVQMTIKTEVLT